MDNMDREAIESREDPALANDFIKKNKSFVLRCASKTAGRFLTENDDEFSVALIAFNEAINSYDESKGAFASFAALIIRRRVIDHIRSESRHYGEIAVEPGAFSGEYEDDENVTAVQMAVTDKVAELSEDNRITGQATVRDEIEAMQSILGEYGFSFYDLVECSPKAGKTKDQCAKVINVLTGDAGLMDRMRSGRTLPVKELCRISGVHKKILERHRKYIIAAAEILSGEYPLLAEYLSFVRKAVT